MTAADPALALCRQLDALLAEDEGIGRLWSAKESALRNAAAADQAKAKQEFDDVEAVANRLHQQIDHLFRAIESARGTTLAGVAAKLRVTLRYGSPKEESDELPWPQMRSALLDLEQMAANDQG